MINKHQCVIIELPVKEVAIVQTDNHVIEIGTIGKQGPAGAYFYPVFKNNRYLGFENTGNLENPDDFDLGAAINLDSYATKQELDNSINAYTAISNFEIYAILSS